MLLRSYSEKESQLKLRTKQLSQKDILFEKVNKIFGKSNSITEFEKLLEQDDIKTYHRNSKLTGVYYGKRRYRFKQSLGIDLGQFQLKDKTQDRLSLLNSISRERFNDKDKGISFY